MEEGHATDWPGRGRPRAVKGKQTGKIVRSTMSRTSDTADRCHDPPGKGKGDEGGWGAGKVKSNARGNLTYVVRPRTALTSLPP
jgi:hypothetical protein